MKHRLLLLLLSSLLWLSSPAIAADVRVAIVKTGATHNKEGLVFSGGSFSKEVETVFSAFIVKHDDDLFLFDSGLGRNVAQQYAQDMPHWNRPFFRLPEKVEPAAPQLAAAGLPPIRRIVLSHAHWDHASGLEDFPGAQVWLADEELGVVRHADTGVGGAWPSQVKDKPVSWKPLPFADAPYQGFERSFDLYGDGSVVLVPMFGHTPGSVGLFVNTSSGKRYFFVGDVVWSAGALPEGRPKFWAARWLADHDVAQTQAAIEKIRAAMARDPALVVVPAHDGSVQDALGYLPKWAP